MLYFNSRPGCKLFIIMACLCSFVFSNIAKADVYLSISSPIPDLREIVDPPSGYQGCYQIPAGVYNGIWVDAYEMCQYPNTMERGMWVSPHWECENFRNGICRSWSWVSAYWNQDWDEEWSSSWIWVSPFWDWRWDPHWNRHWERGWRGSWNNHWRGNWDPNWSGRRDRHWHGERDKRWSPRWSGHLAPHQKAPNDARFFERNFERHRSQEQRRPQEQRRDQENRRQQENSMGPRPWLGRPNLQNPTSENRQKLVAPHNLPQNIEQQRGEKRLDNREISRPEGNQRSPGNWGGSQGNRGGQGNQSHQGGQGGHNRG